MQRNDFEEFYYQIPIFYKKEGDFRHLGSGYRTFDELMDALKKALDARYIYIIEYTNDYLETQQVFDDSSFREALKFTNGQGVFFMVRIDHSKGSPNPKFLSKTWKCSKCEYEDNSISLDKCNICKAKKVMFN